MVSDFRDEGYCIVEQERGKRTWTMKWKLGLIGIKNVGFRVQGRDM